MEVIKEMGEIEGFVRDTEQRVVSIDVIRSSLAPYGVLLSNGIRTLLFNGCSPITTIESCVLLSAVCHSILSCRWSTFIERRGRRSILDREEEGEDEGRLILNSQRR